MAGKNRLSTRIRNYQRTIKRLRDLLSDLEWVQPMYNGSPSCSCCAHQQHFGHAEGCELAVELGIPTGPINIDNPDGPHGGTEG